MTKHQFFTLNTTIAAFAIIVVTKILAPKEPPAPPPPPPVYREVAVGDTKVIQDPAVYQNVSVACLMQGYQSQNCRETAAAAAKTTVYWDGKVWQRTTTEVPAMNISTKKGTK